LTRSDPDGALEGAREGGLALVSHAQQHAFYAALLELAREWNTSERSFVAPAEYLEVVITRA